MADSRLTDLLRHLRTGLASREASPSDREALQAFLASQDEAAFEAIVHRHGPMVYRVCQRVLHHAHDVEDAFQATFLVLARHARSIGKSESLASWLHGVAFRIAKRLRRDAARQRSRELAATLANAPDPADDLLWRDVQFFLEKEIDSLPESYRQVFVLCILEGRSRPEVARELGLNENTVSSRLARARERLQQRLAKRGISLSAVMGALALAEVGMGSAVPKSLLLETSHAASQYAAHKPITGLSPLTQQLAKDTARTMTLSKLSYIAGIFALVGTLAFTAWGLSQEKDKIQAPSESLTPTPKVITLEKREGERIADSVQRKRSFDNLTKLMVAMHNHHDVMGRFPRDKISKDGKPLLSWRVELLPYLGYEDLYKQFKRDESWDSEHNSKLISEMPDFFRTGIEPDKSTDTYYQIIQITRPIDTVEIRGDLRCPLTHFSEVKDGISNTLCIIEAGPKIPWTKPVDLTFNFRNLKLAPEIQWPFKNCRFVSAYDGSSHAIRPDIDDKTLQALFAFDDGIKTPSLYDLRVRFVADTEDAKKKLAQFQTTNQEILEKLQKLNTDIQDLEEIEGMNKYVESILKELEFQHRKNHLVPKIK